MSHSLHGNVTDAFKDAWDKVASQRCGCVCLAEDRESLALPTMYMPNHDKSEREDKGSWNMDCLWTGLVQSL